MKTKRKLKGMTLMEVVVSLAVYAIIGLLLAEIMTLGNATMKATNQLNRRLTYEAKFADNLLLSDGVTSFTNNPISATLSEDNGSFTINANGRVYETNASNIGNNVDSDPNQMIINEHTNYRFLVFSKTYEAAAAQNEYFYLNLHVAPGVDLTADPITKIIVDASGCPQYGGCYANNTEGGNIIPKQVLYASPHTPNAADGDELIEYIGLDSISGGGQLLHLAIPATDGSGNALANLSDPDAGVTGSVKVLIFQSVHDTVGNPYHWYDNPNGPNQQTIRNGALSERPHMVDSDSFPASALLTLDFVLSAKNDNIDEFSYFEGVDYDWNPQADPTQPSYLVARKATGN